VPSHQGTGFKSPSTAGLTAVSKFKAIHDPETMDSRGVSTDKNEMLCKVKG
jgi:hypothetical protein